jgi:hypothetical protein
LIADGTLRWWHSCFDKTFKLSPNLNFTVDTFPDGAVVHFLDKVSVDGTDIYRKDTHTGQYSHFSSFEPFRQNCMGKISVLQGF